jgi:hypothetical protein
MSLCDQIIEALPELNLDDFVPSKQNIVIRDDGDGVEYIDVWNYAKPIPEGFKLGK